MPLTKKGKKIMKAMKEEYGDKKGEGIFYASKNKKTIVGVEKRLVGGLLTKGIKNAYKAFRKSGGRKTSDIVNESKVSRSTAKSDVKSAILREIKSKIPFKNFHINSPHLTKSKRRLILKDLSKLNYYKDIL